MKKPTYPKLIKMFFTNLKINMEHRIFSSLQDKSIIFNCDTLGDILGISNKGSRLFEFKVIPIIEGFVYNDVVVLHMGKYDFAPEAKIKNRDLFLKSRIIHRIIPHNSFSKKEHFFMK